MNEIYFLFNQPVWTGEYTNWRGERRMRTIKPISVWFGKTHFHPQPGWLLKAEAEDGIVKDFALSGFEKPVKTRAKTRSLATALLVQWHTQAEPDAIKRIIRCDTAVVGDDSILLVEVKNDTPAWGIMPVSYAPDEAIPYPVVIIEITPGEWEKVEKGELELPEGWVNREVVYAK
jgi:hypothetical protein